jgi:hypothetical protein
MQWQMQTKEKRKLTFFAFLHNSEVSNTLQALSTHTPSHSWRTHQHQHSICLVQKNNMEMSNMKKCKSLLQKVLSMLEGQLSQAWNAKCALNLNLKINPKPNLISFFVRYKWRVLGKAFVKYPSLWYHDDTYINFNYAQVWRWGGGLRKLHFGLGPLLVYENVVERGMSQMRQQGKGIVGFGSYQRRVKCNEKSGPEQIWYKPNPTNLIARERMMISRRNGVTT